MNMLPKTIGIIFGLVVLGSFILEVQSDAVLPSVNHATCIWRRYRLYFRLLIKRFSMDIGDGLPMKAHSFINCLTAAVLVLSQLRVA